LGKNQVEVDGIIGAPYGSVFEVQNRKLSRVTVETNGLYDDIALPEGRLLCMLPLLPLGCTLRPITCPVPISVDRAYGGGYR